MEDKFKDRRLTLYTAYVSKKWVNGNFDTVVDFGNLEVIENPSTYRVLQDNNSGCYLRLIHKNIINSVDDEVAISFTREQALRILCTYLEGKKESLVNDYNERLKILNQLLFDLSKLI